MQEWIEMLELLLDKKHLRMGLCSWFLWESKVSEKTAKINQVFEWCAKGLDAELVMKVEIPPNRIFGKRPRDPRQFSKQNRCEVQSEQIWWRFLQKIMSIKAFRGWYTPFNMKVFQETFKMFLTVIC